MNRRQTGAAWESLAAEYLERRGVRIVEQNYRCRQGEIDLIGWHQGYLVFIEVKYRKGTGKGYALEAVDPKKQRKICRTADVYRYRHRLGDAFGVRYDVVAVQGGEIQWIRNAFPHIAAWA